LSTPRSRTAPRTSLSNFSALRRDMSVSCTACTARPLAHRSWLRRYSRSNHKEFSKSRDVENRLAVASVKNLGNSISRNRSGERGITLVGRQTSIESYLSTSHRDSTAPICRFAAVGSELRLSGKDTKAAATEALERLIAALSAEAQGSESARRDAIAALSTMIGAMVLARIAGKTNLSSEILDAAKDYLHR
jgi:hypothetical protein